jgi:NADPH:quinone reductase-like Zn-dependent oxidoreductase
VKAFVIDRYKPADGGHLADVPDPRPGPAQVLIEVHAAGVNPLDVRSRSGEFRLFLRHRMPLILGNDVAGVVRAVGTDVSRFKVGDKVFARTERAAGGCSPRSTSPRSPSSRPRRRWPKRRRSHSSG